MKYTQIPSDTFKQIQLNAGILVKEFDPSTGSVSETDIIGATSGGISFEATPTYTDFGEDIDNCPKNMMELKKLESWEVKMSGTFVTVTADAAKMLVGAADADSSDSTHVVPRNDITTADFSSIWWVGDYSDQNGTANGGYCAIKLKNALSTGGFKIQSGDKAKGAMEFEFTGHYSMDAQDEVPFDVYIKSGTAEG